MNGTLVTVVNKDKHLRNYISTVIYDRNIISNFYQRSNSVISDFSISYSETLDKIHSIFCMHMYGYKLWNITECDVNKFYVAWRRVNFRIWKLPITAHNRIIHNITLKHIILEKRLIKFIYSYLQLCATKDIVYYLLLLYVHASEVIINKYYIINTNNYIETKQLLCYNIVNISLHVSWYISLILIS